MTAEELFPQALTAPTRAAAAKMADFIFELILILVLVGRVNLDWKWGIKKINKSKKAGEQMVQ